MMLGSIQAAAANSSHKYSSSPYLLMYCAEGLDDFPISAIIARVRRVFTEMSTVVMVILCHDEVRTICTASGSHQKLNSRRFSVCHSIGTTGAMLPPMMTNSCASSATFGSRLRA